MNFPYRFETRNEYAETFRMNYLYGKLGKICSKFVRLSGGCGEIKQPHCVYEFLTETHSMFNERNQ
jgi:hypothetical protein